MKKVAGIIGGGAILAFYAMNLDVGTNIPVERSVLINRFSGYYATPSCVANGHVTGSFLPTPEDVVGASGQTDGGPKLALISYAEIVGLRDIRGERLRRDPECDGLIEWRPIWRVALDWFAS